MTGERWYEVFDGWRLVFQVSMPAPPIEELAVDLSFLVDGKLGVGPSDYWLACEDDGALREVLVRARKMASA